MNVIIILSVLFHVLIPSLAYSYVAKTYTSQHIRHCQASLLKCGDERSIFIFGLGYVGISLALQFKKMGWNVSGTCTNVNKVNSLRELDINATYLPQVLQRKLLEIDAMNDLLHSSHIITTIAPTISDGDPVLKFYGIDLRNASLAIANKLKWLGYISSTGVYGNRDGEWVTELDKLNPDTLKSKLRAKAEMDWRSLYECNGLPIHIFRLAGIYGPGRSAIDTLLKAKGDMSQCGADNVTFISRIHLVDSINVIIASISNPSPGLILNVADDLPSTRFDVLAYSCRLMSYPIQNPNTGEKYISRGGSKRVDNTKMRQLLRSTNIELLYPDYRSGLLAIKSVQKII